MDLGVLFSLQDPPGSPIGHPAVYQAALEQVVRAEELGYRWACLTEHHVSPDGYLPAVFPMLGAMAARTSRIGLCTGMLILPLHHPVRVAEESAVVDILSGGRLSLGLAAGYRDVEFAALDVPYEGRGVRFDESLDIMRQAWTGDPFSYRGRCFDLPEITVSPRPLQRPHPPLWIGGTSGPALRRAIRVDSPLCPGGIELASALKPLLDRFRQLRSAAALPEEFRTVLPRFAVVASTTDEARRRALPALRALIDRYVSFGLPSSLQGRLTDWDALDDMVVVGDEAHCQRLFAEYEAAGVTDLLLQCALPGLLPDWSLESIERARSAQPT